MATIRKIVEEDFEEVLRFLRRNFYRYEPCALGLDLCPPGYAIPALEDEVRSKLIQGHSYIATEDGDTKGVVVCAVIPHLDKQESSKSGGGDGEETGESGGGDAEEFPAKFHHLETFFHHLITNFDTLDIFEKFGVPEYLEIFMLCTKVDTRRSGLGTRLITTTLQHAQQHDLRLAVTMALSFYSQKIFTKFGFDHECEIDYLTYTQDNKPVFDTDKMGIHKSGQLLIKRI